MSVRWGVAVAVSVGVAVLAGLRVGVCVRPRSGVSVGTRVRVGGTLCVGVTVAVAVRSSARVAVSVGAAVAVRVGVAMPILADAAGVSTLGQPWRALSTPVTSSSMVTASSPFASSAGHVLSITVPRAMLMPVTNSSTVTTPLPLQSPAHAETPGAVCVTPEVIPELGVAGPARTPPKRAISTLRHKYCGTG